MTWSETAGHRDAAHVPVAPEGNFVANVLLTLRQSSLTVPSTWCWQVAALRGAGVAGFLLLSWTCQIDAQSACMEERAKRVFLHTVGTLGRQTQQDAVGRLRVVLRRARRHAIDNLPLAAALLERNTCARKSLSDCRARLLRKLRATCPQATRQEHFGSANARTKKIKKNKI